MSSILEALKKLEEEKAARRSGPGNLTGKVTTSGRKPRTSPAWLIPGGMLIVATVSVLVTYVVMNRAPSSPALRSVPTPREVVPPSAGRPVIPVTPLPAVAPPVTDELSPRRPAPSVEAKKPGRALIRQKAAAPSKAPAKVASSPPPEHADSAAAKAGEPLPKLSVVGIAWQKDNALRLAIVNGAPVREGGTVDGAKVTEILPDRVRFSFKGREFETSLEH